MKLTQMALVFGVALALAMPAAAETAPNPIHVAGAWARSTPPGVKTGAAYMTVTNTGHEDDTLVSVSTPVAGMADVHHTIDDNGVMKMRPAGPVDLKPGASIKLSPGGYHVMLMQLKAPLADGQNFPLTLVFEKAGKVQVDVHVQRMPPAGQAGDHAGHSMGGHSMGGMDMPGMAGH